MSAAIIFDRARGHAPVRERVTRCSWCKRFRADDGDWFSITAMGLLEFMEHWFVIEHGRCWDCRRTEQEGLI